jgi:hyperosmotically inducible protein
MSGSATETGQVVDDAALTAKVKAALASDAGLKTLGLNVYSSAGVVTLSGVVDSQMLKDNAVKVAESVQGVKSVNNNLVVAEK